MSWQALPQGVGPLGHVLLLEGENAEGMQVYAFLAVPHDRVPAVLAAARSGVGFDPAAHGRILQAGPGRPTAYLVRQVLRDFDVAPAEAE